MSWWRRNRWGLAGLPLAAALAAAGNASLVAPQWYDVGFHAAQTPGADGWTTATAQVRGGADYVVSARLHLVAVEPVTSVPGPDGDPPGDRPAGETAVQTPPGTVLWRISVDVRADPSTILDQCRVALVDHRDRLFDTLAPPVTATHGAATPGPGSTGPGPNVMLTTVTVRPRCVPPDTPGPQWDLVAQAVRPAQVPRPAAYRLVAYAVTPRDARPVEVRVWWQLPRYAALPVPG